MHHENDSVNVKEWSSASDILRRAAVLIEEKGWYQETGPERPEALGGPGGMCATTALEMAWRQSGKSLVDMQYASTALSDTIHAPKVASRNALDVPYWGAAIVAWNDQPGRTEEEVVSTFLSASNFADQKSREAAERG